MGPVCCKSAMCGEAGTRRSKALRHAHRCLLRTADWTVREIGCFLRLGSRPKGRRSAWANFLADLGAFSSGRLLSSGRAGLALALQRAAGGAPNVILPSFLCRAVAEAVLWAGKRPVFVDVRDDLNLDVRQVEDRLGDEVSAVVVPHMFGKPAEIEAVVAMCEPRGILVIDDAAAAMGIRRGGRYLGCFGDAGVFSFAQQKSLVAGRGGALLVSSGRARGALKDLELSEPKQGRAVAETLWWIWAHQYAHRLPALRWRLLRARRALGIPPRPVGIRAEKLPAVNAAIIEVQISRMNEILDSRLRNCRELHLRLDGLKGLTAPQYSEGCMLTRFFVRTLGRRWEYDERGVRKMHPLAEHLARRGIETSRPYVPLHRQSDLARYADGPLPRTDEIVAELVALPIQGRMSERDYDAIADGVRSFCT